MKRWLLPLLILLPLQLPAQERLLKEMEGPCDSLAVLLEQRMGVKGELRLHKVLKRGKKADFYFTRTLSDFPWRDGDIQWFRQNLEGLFPEGLSGYGLGDLFCHRSPLTDNVTPFAGSDGNPVKWKYQVKDPGRRSFITGTGSKKFRKGLSGRHIALWQSHGRYFNENEGRWSWQRAPLHTTVEDLYTQSYVLPFLIPMLENAGAYVMTPRERDTQWREVVCDNDPAFAPNALRTGRIRRDGLYFEKGSWSDAGEGFADLKPYYSGLDNPFTMGSARQAASTPSTRPTSYARWIPDVEERGWYAVYISYRSLENSSRSARYTVRHLGGTEEFVVDQRIGGGTWIYLGTWEFAPGDECCVTLDNSTVKGFTFQKNTVVCADAVRFGGGMGKVARGPEGAPENWTLSGLPSYMEGAMYSMQWAGMDPSVFEEWDNDYIRDYASRGAWVKKMRDDKGIPFDMSLAFHSDAGTAQGDSIVGTLSIYTLMSEGKRKYSGGADRMEGRLLADFVQSQVVQDIREDFNSEWTRRRTMDRGYSESRTTDMPSMILELLSHQNFADMRHGLDPAFRFTASRAVYKGILKFLSSHYGFKYCVQPLPVKDFSVRLDRGSAILQWSPSPDPKEPTAMPSGYIVHIRKDDGAFSSQVEVSGTTLTVPLEEGVLYGFKVEAFNDGGKSFPSEILSAARSRDSKGTVLVVNNFDRVSGPVWFDAGPYAGFDTEKDAGVPYIRDISYVGKVYEFRRDKPWVSDFNPGFGASDTDRAGIITGGNTFDYPAVHGKHLLELGYSFCSSSRDAFVKGIYASPLFAIDLVCGKQLSTPSGNGIVKYSVLPAGLREELAKKTAEGCHLMVSGAYIATDAWDSFYPGTECPSRQEVQDFVRWTLGYEFVSSRGCSDGAVTLKDLSEEGRKEGRSLKIRTEASEDAYRVENPGAIKPSCSAARQAAFYPSTGAGAGVFFEAPSYRTACFSFPVEALEDEGQQRDVFESVFGFFER